MYLSEVRIVGFRCFEDVTVQLCEGLNVIVGENNIGKTNLLDAIRIALGPSASGRQGVFPDKGDLHRKPDGSRAPFFEVHLVFSGLVEQEMAQFIEGLCYDLADPPRSKLRLHYRWLWNETTQRYTDARWGGPDETEANTGLDGLQGIPVTYLEPLRDAMSALVGGRTSRLARLIRKLSNPEREERLVQLFEAANSQLEDEELLSDARKAIEGNLTLFREMVDEIGVAPSTPDFDAIIRALRLVVRLPGLTQSGEISAAGGEQRRPIAELSENGLGYNNLLYIATVLAELTTLRAGECPLLMVEEPEAHLHPQWQTLLGRFLLEETEQSEQGPKEKDASTMAGLSHRRPQILMTTHSPHLAAYFPPNRIVSLHKAVANAGRIRSAALWQTPLKETEYRALQRLMEVTKATLFFARGVILVEGISEQLLLPALARLAGKQLDLRGISVVPVHGVSFGILVRLFEPGLLEIPCAVLTDSDPELVESVPLIADLRGTEWSQAPALDQPSPRLESLSRHISSPLVIVKPARVNLEYDLAEADGSNALLMGQVWSDMRARKVNPLAPDILGNLVPKDRATLVWQTICLRGAGREKAAFAQRLAERLGVSAKTPDAEPIKFRTPDYIAEAIDFVWGQVGGRHGKEAGEPVD